MHTNMFVDCNLTKFDFYLSQNISRKELCDNSVATDCNVWQLFRDLKVTLAIKEIYLEQSIELLSTDNIEITRIFTTFLSFTANRDNSKELITSERESIWSHLIEDWSYIVLGISDPCLENVFHYCLVHYAAFGLSNCELWQFWNSFILCKFL